ncbi:MAG: hypothetical protein JWL69_2706 [Phycisphaerales bacterium]|nr:hypothetical protein [Phycisphaerales bacterium]
MSIAAPGNDEPYRLLVERLDDCAIFMLDVNGLVASWNDGARVLSQFSPKEIIGRPGEVLFTPEDRQANAPRHEMKVAEKEGRASDERWHLRKDGSRFFASGVLTALRNEAGDLLGYAKVLRDLTERKRAEQRLGIEQAIVSALAQATTLQEAIPRTLQAVCETADWEWAALWIVDEAKRVLRCSDIWHPAPDAFTEFETLSRATSFESGVGLPGRVWASGKPAWISDVTEDANFPRKPAAARVGLHGAFGFPVLLGEQVLGVMEFFTREVRPPDHQMLTMMLVIGGQIGQFIERRRSERLLLGSEARNRAVLETALDCIVSMDHQGRVIEWNPAAERTFGYTRDECLGQQMAELIIPPSLREAHRRGLAKYLETGEGPVIGRRIEITACRKDGSEFQVELAITRVPLPGPASFIGFMRDITQRKSAEQERDQLLEGERAARAEVERAGRIKDEFLATLSHELRTPLNAILGWAQILRGGSRDERDLTQGLETIERNARAQTQIIQDLLDMSRIVSGKVRLDVQRIDLPAVIRTALDTVQPAAAAKDIRLQPALDPLAGPVTGDPNRLQQVFWNLLTNAIKFTPKGGRIQILLERVNSHLEVSVIDSGEGIKPDFLPFLFERFRQADGSTTRQHGGLGLGLAIVKQLVELHGGTIRARSAGAGEGATFVVSLPLTVVHPELEETPARQHPGTSVSASSISERLSLEGIKVLVVDDEPDARRLIQRFLSDFKAEVTAVGSAAEAIDALQTLRPDVLVSDIGMPGEDGYALIRKVRKLGPDRGGNVPALALTAYARSEDRQRAIMCGYHMHVSKPVEPSELITMVASLAGRTAEDTDS